MPVTNQLTLFMPDLLIAAQGQTLPALAVLLGRAEVTPMPQDLYALFNMAQASPSAIAAFAALGDGLAVQSNEWWLRADPAEMQADQATVYLVGTEHFELEQAEVNQLVSALNQFMQQDGLRLFAPHPLRWYLKLAAEPGLVTAPPQDFIGKPLRTYLTAGEQQQYWRKLFTELQLLLACHPVNQQRLAQGKPLINGLWFWGEGRLPIQSPVVSWNKVFTDDPLSKGLAYWQQLAAADIPAHYAECSLQLAQAGDYLLIPAHITVNNIAVWEQNWFRPLLNALQTGQLGELTIFTQQQCFTVNHKQLRKWWRRGYRF